MQKIKQNLIVKTHGLIATTL